MLDLLPPVPHRGVAGLPLRRELDAVACTVEQAHLQPVLQRRHVAGSVGTREMGGAVVAALG